MIWTDGRGARDERWRRRRARLAKWHVRFAWLPVMLDDPPSKTVWLGTYEARYIQGHISRIKMARAVGSSYA